MSAKYVVKLTMDDCKKLGIVVCKHCGYPPNNHFDFPPQTCAHAPCPGYEPRFRYGRAIELNEKNTIEAKVLQKLSKSLKASARKEKRMDAEWYAEGLDWAAEEALAWAQQRKNK